MVKEREQEFFASFEIGVRSGNEFVGIGQVGTGFSEAELFNLTNALRKNIEAVEKNKYKFLPRVVLEVSADLVSRDAQGNIELRFPRCNRIRDDKFVNDINTFDDVVRLM